MEFPGRGVHHGDAGVWEQRIGYIDNPTQKMTRNKETTFFQTCDTEHGTKILEVGALGQDERQQWDQLPDVCLCFPVTLPATIMTSSIPTTVGGHMMYPSPHAVMYAPTSGLADGSLTVLNAFSQAPSTMQVSHSQVQEQGEGRARAEGRRTISPFYRHSNVS